MKRGFENQWANMPTPVTSTYDAKRLRPEDYAAQLGAYGANFDASQYGMMAGYSQVFLAHKIVMTALPGSAAVEPHAISAICSAGHLNLTLNFIQYCFIILCILLFCYFIFFFMIANTLFYFIRYILFSYIIIIFFFVFIYLISSVDLLAYFILYFSMRWAESTFSLHLFLSWISQLIFSRLFYE